MRFKSLLIAALAVALSAQWARAQDPPPSDPPPPPADGAPAAGAPQVAAEDMAYGGYPYGSVWHGGYAHPMFARPLAIVVPNVSNYQTHWGWGVSMTQMTPINPQYSAPMPGYDYNSDHRYHTRPYWPTDTRQFGVYMIRAPVE